MQCCYRLNVSVLPEFICGNLTPGVIVFGGAPLGSDYVMRAEPYLSGISSPRKEAPEITLTPSTE